MTPTATTSRWSATTRVPADLRAAPGWCAARFCLGAVIGHRPRIATGARPLLDVFAARTREPLGDATDALGGRLQWLDDLAYLVHVVHERLDGLA